MVCSRCSAVEPCYLFDAGIAAMRRGAPRFVPRALKQRFRQLPFTTTTLLRVSHDNCPRIRRPSPAARCSRREGTSRRRRYVDGGRTGEGGSCPRSVAPARVAAITESLADSLVVLTRGSHSRILVLCRLGRREVEEIRFGVRD